ncbi:MAG TPA: hypothetical protein VD864_18510 [Nocardioides sp.]|nr:hypothetical protein [Nocardioides sp.]
MTAGILGTWSLGGAAVADPKGDHADHGRHLGQDKNADKNADKKGAKPKGDKPKGGDKDKGDNGRHLGHANAPGQNGQGKNGQGQNGQGKNGEPGKGAAFGQGDPAGNNGTVKIAGPGDEAGHPSNNPHPGCTFLIEWFGFDEGADVVSTVSFASQAPTSDVVLGGTSPAEVFVGGDPASGGTDLDGRQAYSLTFQGEPHPKQGYHVKVTVATPRSLGNDTKTKVFWVEPCATAAPDTPDEGGTGSTDEETPDQGVSDEGTGTTGDSTDEGVLGETYAADADEAAADEAASAAVPTAVDAGEEGLLPTWARSPLPLTLISFALVLAGVGIVLRNRSRA